MKKLFFLFALFGLFATSCEESNIQEPNDDNPIENPDDDDEEKPVFTVESDYTIIIEADGGEFDVLVTTNLEYNVVIDKESQSWVSVADTRAVRKEKLTFTIAPNEQYVSRVATISLIDKDKTTLETFTIEQLPASCASNELLYTSTDGQPIYVDVSAIGVVMTENIYENGVGVMRFNGIITTIPNQLFYDCKNLKSIILPDSVTTIGYGAFQDCTSLTSVIIGNGVTTLGDYAFYGCGSLTSVTIGDSVTTIGYAAFAWCKSLTSVTIPDSVTTIGNGVFSGCGSLKEFNGKFAADNGRCLIKDNTIIAYAEASGTTYTIPDSVTTIGQYAFCDCDSLTSVTIGNSVTTIGDYAFSGCESLTSVTIPDSVTTIGEGTFSWCNSLTSVTIPNSVTTIGGHAFRDCNSLTSVTIPNSVTTIGEGAFYHCDSLTSVTIGDSVTTIGYAAFSSCYSLTSVTIPDSVTAIGEMAFYCCDNLKTVYCKPTTPPTGGSYMFDDNAAGRKIYVPTGSGADYKEKQYWSNYADYIEEDASL